MPVNRDFSDLFSALNAADAKYLMVGGYAVSYHSEPRFTKDLDIWVEASTENAAAVYKGLQHFGAPMSMVTESDLATPSVILQIGVPPNRIDLVTSIDGVSFAEAWPERIDAAYGPVTIHIIAKRHLILNKRTCARPQDLIDADRLSESGLTPDA